MTRLLRAEGGSLIFFLVLFAGAFLA